MKNTCFFLSTLYIVSTSLGFIRFGFSEEVAGNYQFLFKATLSMLYLAFFVFFILTNNKVLKVNVLVLAYGLICFFSFVWAYDATAFMPAYISLLNCFIFYYFCKSFGWRFILEVFRFSTLVVSLLSIFVSIYHPELAYDFLEGKYRFSGASYGAHAIVRLAVFWLVFESSRLIIDSVRPDKWFYFSVSVSLVLCILTDSRQGQIILLTALGCYLLSTNILTTSISVTIGALLTLLFVSIFVDSFDVVDLLARQDKSEIYTFTNRTFIWEFVIDKISERPWLGYGFGNASLIINTLFTKGDWTTTSAHNGILHLMLELGVLGFIWFVVSLIRCLINVLNNLDIVSINLALSFVVLIFLEQSIAGAPDYILAFWFLLSSNSKQYRQFIS